MSTNKILASILALAGLAVSHAAGAANTYTWSGSVDNYWLTPGNWTVNGATATTAPGNEDTVVFNKADDTTLMITNAAAVAGNNNAVKLQSLVVGEDAGALTLSLQSGSYNDRYIQFRRVGTGSDNPKMTNIVNHSTNPITFGSRVRITFNNNFGDMAVMPGVIYNNTMTMASDAKAWFLQQPALRTDNEEMNKSVFKGAATFTTNGVSVGANHWIVLQGTGASFTVPGELTLNGKIFVNAGTLSYQSLKGDGEIIVSNGSVISNDLGNAVIGVDAEFGIVNNVMTNKTVFKIAKGNSAAAPTAANFKLNSLTGLTPAATNAISFAVDATSDSDYYLISVTPAFFATMTGNNTYSTDMTASGLWYGATEIAAGTHYLIQGKSHRLNTKIGNDTMTFVGKSLDIVAKLGMDWARSGLAA